MSGTGIRIVVKDAATEKVAALAAALEHPRPMWDLIGAYGVASTQRRFEAGVDPEGSPWPPSLRALATGGKTLIDTARLMQSQTHNASDSGVEWGTNVLYAAIHQFGGIIAMPARTQTTYRKINKRTGEPSAKFVRKDKADFAQDHAVEAHTVTIPRRAFLGLDDYDESEIVRIAEDYLARTLS